MKKALKYLDILLLAALGILLIIAVFKHFTEGFVLTANFYLGAIGWFVVVLLTIKNSNNAKGFLVCLLLFSVLNIVSFTTDNYYFGVGKTFRSYHKIDFFTPGVNPIFLLVFVIYALINYDFMGAFFRRVFKGSDNEIDEAYQKQLKFYSDLFSTANKQELEFALNNLKNYPEAAQEVLESIKLGVKVEGIDE